MSNYFDTTSHKRAILSLICVLLLLNSCKDVNIKNASTKVIVEKCEFGYNLNDYTVIQDTLELGDSFGEILQRNNLDYSKIVDIVDISKKTVDIRKLKAGKPYTLLCTKDSTKTPQCFIYQPNKEEYVVVDFADSIMAYNASKPITVVKKQASGTIISSLSETMEAQGLPYELIEEMSDIYAWTIDFFRLQKGDSFKIMYEQRYINDTIPAGIETVHASTFTHKNNPFYAFNYSIVKDSVTHITEYFDENAKSLRRSFLKAPVKYSRISSRYNLNRRIAYYGYRVRPHLGTDFAAPRGTPILATANGTVVESRRKRGNGKYVKIKHNSIYSTQYLHMKAQKVRVGDYVKQGDVIGWVGMTGNTSGPHVCYRFWKNGRQVDPLKQKLPEAKSIPSTLKEDYFKFITPLKKQLDSIPLHQPIIPNTV